MSGGSEARPSAGAKAPQAQRAGSGGRPSRRTSRAGPDRAALPLPPSPAPPQGPPGEGGKGRGRTAARVVPAGAPTASRRPLTLSPSMRGAGEAPRPAATGSLGADRKPRQLRPGLPSNRRRGGSSRSAERWMSAGARREDGRMLLPQGIVGKGRGGDVMARVPRCGAAGWRWVLSSPSRARSGSLGCLNGLQEGFPPRAGARLGSLRWRGPGGARNRRAPSREAETGRSPRRPSKRRRSLRYCPFVG